MNILPMILIFLTIFSYVAVTFIKEAKTLRFFETTLTSYERTERALNNTLSRRIFAKVKTQPKTTTTTPAQKRSTPHVQKREFSPPLELSKFNLSPLLKEEGTQVEHPLYKPLVECIRILYHKHLFALEKKSETLPSAIVSAMLKTSKKVEDPKLLADLCPEDAYLKGLYYKMLKGTRIYTKEKGIPPLDHFFTIDDANKISICVTFASQQLLRALFGEKIANSILDFEKKKFEETQKIYFFSKQDLQAIYQSPMLALLDPHLSDTKKFEKRENIGALDKITGMVLEKAL